MSGPLVAVALGGSIVVTSLVAFAVAVRNAPLIEEPESNWREAYRVYVRRTREQCLPVLDYEHWRAMQTPRARVAAPTATEGNPKP